MAKEKATEGEEFDVYDGEPDYPHAQANQQGAQDNVSEED